MASSYPSVVKPVQVSTRGALGPPTPVAGLEMLAQKRLEETSTSLEAALKVVENKLAQGNRMDG